MYFPVSNANDSRFASTGVRCCKHSIRHVCPISLTAQACKQRLLSELGLPFSSESHPSGRPLVAVVSRLTEQKGWVPGRLLCTKCMMHPGTQAYLIGIPDQHCTGCVLLLGDRIYQSIHNPSSHKQRVQCRGCIVVIHSWAH
jgi:hypothetical protein